MQQHQIAPRTLVLVLIGITAALIMREWARTYLTGSGFGNNVAADLSYLVVPPVLLVLLAPLWRKEKPFVLRIYDRSVLSLRVVLSAIAIGLLLRAASWGHIVAGVSFGLYISDNPNAIVGPQFSWQCDPLPALALGLFVMALLIPFIEELVHRGYVVTVLQKYGVVPAVLISSLVFMVFHQTGTWSTALVAGVVLAVLFWRSGSLWPGTIVHAVFNAMSQIDWRCLRGQWNPKAEQLPLWAPGLTGLAVVLLAGVLIVILIRKIAPGTALCREH